MMKVSVIIPVYNVEKYIEECLESVLNQTLQEIEIICINDASTDSSWEVVQKFAARDSRLILLENEKNCGLAYTRNKGLNIARGEYVYMLDSDDSIAQTALESLFETGCQEGLDVIFFDANVMFENTGLKKKFPNYKGTLQQQYNGVMSGKELFIQWQENRVWISSVPRFFYKREFLSVNCICFINGLVHEDGPFTFEVLMKASKVKYIKQPFFNRRFREGSIMTRKSNLKNLEGYLMMICRLLQVQRNQQEDKRLHLAVQRLLCRMYQNAIGIYCTMEGQILKEGFDSRYEEVNILFCIFRDVNIGVEGVRQIQGDKVYSELIKMDKVYIYGAGIYAKKTLSLLEPFHLIVKNMLVKYKENNPRAVGGIEVRGIESVSDFHTPVIVGVSDRFREEVVEELIGRGFKNILELKF